MYKNTLFLYTLFVSCIKNENAKNFLKAGVDINIIAPCTGLSMEEVEKLQDEINKIE